MTDIEIARSIKMQPIEKIAKKLKIKKQDLIFYGKYKAKIDAELKEPAKQKKLILVTAINPTKAGIGKTTSSLLSERLLLGRSRRAFVVIDRTEYGR